LKPDRPMTSQNSPDPPELKDKLAEIFLQVLMKGGVGVGGAGAFWHLFVQSDIPKSIASAGIGIGISYGAKLLQPVHAGNERRLEDAGKTIDRQIDQTISAVKTIGIDDKYWDCQALECLEAKSLGIPQYDGIFVPLLEKVFVELQLDHAAQNAGYMESAFSQDGRESCDRLQIWDLLKRSPQQPIFRRMALQAWGGYGKTTLMRHIAYVYSKNKQPRGLDRKLPVLIILGRYRELLSGAQPPTLADFIHQHHIPDLPGGADLQVPEQWAHQMLKQGRGLILMDGFDEVPQALRSPLTQWINTQIDRYPKTIFILTSRPKAYREQQAGSQPLAISTAFWVQEFDDQQRHDFIHRWYLCQEIFARGGRQDAAVQQTATRSAQDLYDQIDRRRELKDMAKNPLLLTMMTTFHRRNNGADLPKRRVELYQEICRLQLKDRPGARQLETALLHCDAQGILQPLALEMMQRQSRLLSRTAVLAIFQKTLTEKSEKIAAADFLEQVVTVSELLIRQEEEYEFAHLSFQEYLAAKEIVDRQQEALLYEHLGITGEFADSWLRLLLLYVGLVNPTNLIREALRQGKPDLADQLYRETTKQIDDSLIAELETNLKSAVQDSKYAQLEALLQAGEWEEADQETYRLMITIVGKEVGQGFTSKDLAEFPCEDLLTIDRLWVDASRGHFGFSVQKKIWQECGSPTDFGENWNRFCDRVGWQKRGKYVNYADLAKNPSFSFKGELPRWVSEMGGWGNGGSKLFSRAQTCEL
jgi:predicted NACHT family NTPase